jgi:predicted PurR-regulated permease PerM
MWFAALTALAIAVLTGLTVYVGSLVVRGLAFLQPLLIPIVVAVILAYLLEPVVARFCAWGMSRLWSVLLLFALLATGAAGIVLWVAPAISHQAVEVGSSLPEYTARGEKLLLGSLEWVRGLQSRFEPSAAVAEERTIRDEVWAMAGGYAQRLVEWVQESVPDFLAAAGRFLQQSLGGVLGVAGVAVSLLLVPLFLFFFLKDADSLARDWRKYIPLPESPLKNEIASLVEEINSYLIRYFRGQFLVSIIDGALIGAALLVLGVNFALLIGLAVAILALIPYLGMLLCWIPAVLIAAAQFGDWTHPLIVTAIFIGMNNLEGFFISPRIVGDSVSLAPFTVILSVLLWSLVLGGLLGALLAVPLTATIKVLLQRYVWHQRI